jgi:hypothetical protein
MSTWTHRVCAFPRSCFTVSSASALSIAPSISSFVEPHCELLQHRDPIRKGTNCLLLKRLHYIPKMFSLAFATTFLLAFPASVLSVDTGALHRRSQHGLVVRADPGCPTLGQSSEGRKVGIVIDSSGSNVDTDPNNLRIAAGKAISSVLITKAQAGANGHPDVVTVIDFDYSATIVYPLGDPASATFDGIDSSGGTYIAGGLQTAIDELTKNAGDPTAHRSGIVVLTDGEDSSITDLITQLNRAQGLGIRVAFGFLSPALPADSQDLLTAILNTGGVYSTIDSAEAQQNFVSVVLAHGLTDGDGSGSANGTTVLLPGVSIAANISASTSPQTFVYNAQAAEKLNFTVTSVSGQALDAKVRDVVSSKDLGSASTDASGFASITLDAASTGDLELIVSTTNTTSGLISVGVKSNLNRTTGLCGQNTTLPSGPATK